jgi:hypothetical protein
MTLIVLSFIHLVISVPQAKWDPKSSPPEDTPKIRLQATKENDVEENEEVISHDHGISTIKKTISHELENQFKDDKDKLPSSLHHHRFESFR